MGSVYQRIVDGITDVPIFEISLFLFLAVLTFYRRELSSNRGYRNSKSLSKKKSSLTTPDWETLSKLPNTLMEQWPGAEAQPHTPQSRITAALGDKFSTLVHNSDVFLLLVGYLSNPEIARLSTTSVNCHQFLNSEFVWEQLWLQRYRELWHHPTIKEILGYRGIEWDPMSNWGPPSQGWKVFLLEFEYGWMDWALAGCNSANFCTLGLDGGVYDITSLIPDHPGSPETLMDHAGGDASAIFSEIGHSFVAHMWKDTFFVIKPNYIRCLKKAMQWERYQMGQAPLLSQSGSKETDDALKDDDSGPFTLTYVDPVTSKFNARMAMERKAVLKMADSVLRYVNVTDEFRICSVPNMDHIDCHNFEVNRSQPVLHSGLVFSHAHLHSGQPRAYYDPLLQEWCVWWTCCGWGSLVPRGQAEVKAGQTAR